MHELTLAKALVEMASDYAARNGAPRVKRISVRLGVLAGIMRSLYFCFEPASRGTRCEGAVLDIEEVPLTVQCTACNEIKTPKGLYNFRCPTCGRPTPKVVTGREMQLVALELERTEPAAAGSPDPGEADVRSAPFH